MVPADNASLELHIPHCPTLLVRQRSMTKAHHFLYQLEKEVISTFQEPPCSLMFCCVVSHTPYLSLFWYSGPQDSSNDSSWMPDEAEGWLYDLDTGLGLVSSHGFSNGFLSKLSHFYLPVTQFLTCILHLKLFSSCMNCNAFGPQAVL